MKSRLPFGSASLERSLPSSSGFVGCITIRGWRSFTQKYSCPSYRSVFSVSSAVWRASSALILPVGGEPRVPREDPVHRLDDRPHLRLALLEHPRGDDAVRLHREEGEPDTADRDREPEARGDGEVAEERLHPWGSSRARHRPSHAGPRDDWKRRTTEPGSARCGPTAGNSPAGTAVLRLRQARGARAPGARGGVSWHPRGQ